MILLKHLKDGLGGAKTFIETYEEKDDGRDPLTIITAILDPYQACLSDKDTEECSDWFTTDVQEVKHANG